MCNCSVVEVCLPENVDQFVCVCVWRDLYKYQFVETKWDHCFGWIKPGKMHTYPDWKTNIVDRFQLSVYSPNLLIRTNMEWPRTCISYSQCRSLTLFPWCSKVSRNIQLKFFFFHLPSLWYEKNLSTVVYTYLCSVHCLLIYYDHRFSESWFELRVGFPDPCLVP